MAKVDVVEDNAVVAVKQGDADVLALAGLP